MQIDLALYQPDIAQNTGAMLRLGACLGAVVHIIHPTGFPFSHSVMRRSGLDYMAHVEMREHVSFEQFNAWRTAEARRLLLLSTKADTSLYDTAFVAGDIIMVGRESAGVPDGVAAQADQVLRIPMQPGMRSLNVGMSAAMSLGEARRQVAFAQVTPAKDSQ
jgi:tRNA (cytidine/uridine-2'-O-)-methyltransferase